MPKKKVEKKIKAQKQISTPNKKTKQSTSATSNKKTGKKPNILTVIKNKKNIFYTVLIIIDIIIIIYFARHNFANYVSLEGSKSVFIGDKKDLLFGKNYITLITTLFFYIYILISNKMLFHQKNTKKFSISLLIFLILLNTILFFIFTKRVY